MATFADNKKVRFDYEILETTEAGLDLLGPEVQSIRHKNLSLDGARVVIRGGEGYLIGATIAPYQPNNPDARTDPERPIRLLLSKKELSELAGKVERPGLTLVPISVYNKGRIFKLSVGLVRGKKKYDKRETIKRREADRDIGRSLKDF
jgi:SsrA-binding protein